VRLDIVMPAHNEQERIDRTLRAYRPCWGSTGRAAQALRTPRVMLDTDWLGGC
jgi:hypothetical protein